MSADWWNAGVPAFVVVGRVNSGKTATLATLLEVDDDAILRVSSTPGETTRVQPLPVIYDDEEWIRFFDTPGFQQPVEAMRAIQRLGGERTPGPEEIRRFVEECAGEFPDEVRLLGPVVRGAGILYVVDPCKPLRDSFIAEMEILRCTGRPRLALLNPQGESTDHEEAWRDRLGASFNLVRTFDAHAARYRERRKLLSSLLQIEERQADRIEHVIGAMTREWEQRREEAAEALMDFLADALALRTYAGLEERDQGVASRRQRKEEALVREYFARLAKLEARCLDRWLKTYRHHLVTSDIDPRAYRGLDLATEETWRKWGLDRWQLVAAGAMTGGAAGAAFDLSVGAHSLGAGALIGALGGATAAFFKGGQLPELAIRLGQEVTWQTGNGVTLAVGPPRNPNFPWVLLDSMLVRYHGLLERAHGRRDTEPIKKSDESFARNFDLSRRRLLQGWFDSCLKGTPDRSRESEVFAALLACLDEVETPH